MTRMPIVNVKIGQDVAHQIANRKTSFHPLFFVENKIFNLWKKTSQVEVSFFFEKKKIL